MAQRIKWMDALRGLAMVMLLTMHAATIPSSFGYHAPTWVLTANALLTPWRMPTLMFLSGMLLSRGLAKPRGVYFAGKARKLLWPYLVFVAIQHWVQLHPADVWQDPSRWIGPGYMWFLWQLMIFFLIAPLVTRLPGWVLIPLLALGSVLIPIPHIANPCHFGVFFFGGHYARGALTRVAKAPWGVTAVAAAISVGFAYLNLTTTVPGGATGTAINLVKLPFMFLMIAVSIRLVAGLETTFSTTAPMRGLTWIGRHSIVYYLAHMPFMVWLCRGLWNHHITLEWWIMPACLGTALVLCTLLAHLDRRIPVKWLFEAPQLPRRKAGAGVGAAGAGAGALAEVTVAASSAGSTGAWASSDAAGAGALGDVADAGVLAEAKGAEVLTDVSGAQSLNANGRGTVDRDTADRSDSDQRVPVRR